MQVTILSVTTLISDQYGTTKTDLIGVFSDEKSLKIAKSFAENKYSGNMSIINEKKVDLNLISR